MASIDSRRTVEKAIWIGSSSYLGVSGGSVTAAYFGLKGRAALSDFRERFLIRNAEEDSNTSVNLRNIAQGLNGGVNVASRFTGWLDRNLFDNATLGDLFQQGKPIIWLNASDLYNRTPFLFSPVTFAALCSDIGKFPLSYAVAGIRGSAGRIRPDSARKLPVCLRYSVSAVLNPPSFETRDRRL